MYNKFKLASLFILFTCSINAQISGRVWGESDGKKEPLPGAQVKLLGSQQGAITNQKGDFNLPNPIHYPDTLVFQFTGFRVDTLILSQNEEVRLEVTLYSNLLLQEVVAESRQKSSGILRLEPLHIEQLNEGELRKAACCNISESFETNASVDVNFTDAVSGARRIQMMGLDGVYTQLQLENIPFLRGLSSSFGLSSIPGTWVESIQITKGTGSVVNGYESMAGLINFELKKAETSETFYLNAYGNRFGRAELNLHSGQFIGKKKNWSSATFIHGSGVFMEVDNNKDGFRDNPLSQTLSGLNRWSYEGKKFEMKFMLSGHYDQKYGGQLGFNPRNPGNKFGADILNRDLEAFLKTGFFLQKRKFGSIGLIYKGKIYEQNARFGLQSYTGKEKRFYFNGIYSDILGNTNNDIKAGVSLVYANFKEQFNSLNMSRTEIVPGAFAEYTYTGQKFTSVIGMRGDYHNLFGFQASPRVHLKWRAAEYTDIRFTGGRGWRVPNYVADNVSMLASNRIWLYNAQLAPEISWNIGGSIVQGFKLFGRTAGFTLDYYHTRFTDQLIMDLEDPYTIEFYNMSGTSYSNTVQVEFNYEPFREFELKLIYKLTDVKANFGGMFQQRMMVPVHRGLANFAYRTRNKRWEFDLTGSVMGMMRLNPVPQAYAEDFPGESPVFFILNAQITHVYKKWDFYLGGENLTNYIQRNAIVGAENPFGGYFDATRVYAPVAGANVYLGLRYKIERKCKTELLKN
jgi:outer membrane receptor for ferrienterochelin and colicins